MWNIFVERVDEDTMSINNHMDRHCALLDDFLQFRCKAEELIRRYKSHFEQMEVTLVEKSHYIELLEINLVTLTLRVDAMEDQLCYCRDQEVPHTGGKGWCTRLVHCKYTARTWTKYPPYTDLGTGSTFRIFQANFFAVSLVQEIPGTFTVSPVM